MRRKQRSHFQYHSKDFSNWSVWFSGSLPKAAEEEGVSVIWECQWLFQACVVYEWSGLEYSDEDVLSVVCGLCVTKA